MKLRLKPGSRGFVPNGNEFTDPRTGKKFCGYQLSVEGAIKAIVLHRQKNPQIYPKTEPVWTDEESVRQEFYRHLQSRDASLVVVLHGESVQPPQAMTENKTCPNCGSSDIEEQVCPTCSGRRIIGYKCKVCGSNLV